VYDVEEWENPENTWLYLSQNSSKSRKRTTKFKTKINEVSSENSFHSHRNRGFRIGSFTVAPLGIGII